MADVEGDEFVEQFELPKADQDLIRSYAAVGRTVDDLAYTDDFEHLYRLYTQSGHAAPKHEVFRRLLVLRKSGLLPRLFRPTEQAAAANP